MPLAALLLCVGLSSSVQLGEVSPGVVGHVILSADRWEAQTTLDTTDKARHGAPTGGWIAAQSIEAALGPGVLIGAEYRHRDGGGWTKRSAWVRGGWAHARGANVLHVIGRAIVWSDAGASNAAREAAIQLEYRRYFARWLIATEQGVLVYEQHGWHAGYYMTATVGLVLR